MLNCDNCEIKTRLSLTIVFKLSFRRNAKMIVEMSGASTKISNPEVKRVFCHVQLFCYSFFNERIYFPDLHYTNHNAYQDSNESKTFAFDYSYWSFDGSKDRGNMPTKEL